MPTTKGTTTTSDVTPAGNGKVAIEVPQSAITAAEGTTRRAAARKRAHKSTVKVLFNTDDLVKDQVNGFVDFLREHAIVGLAVGFVIGTQAQTVVKQLVTSFIDPMIQLFLGGTTISTRTTTLHLFGNQAAFGWGAMIYALINLFFVLASIYALIRIFKLDKLDKPQT